MTHRLTRFLLSAVIAVFVTTIALAQADPFAGTWTLNVAKSKYDPGPTPKSGSVTFSSKGDNVKAVIDGMTGTG